MDPVLVATMTSALAVLAREVGKAAAGETGKQLWKRISDAFGWKSQPAAEDLAPEIAKRLLSDEALAKKIVGMLKEQGPDASVVGSLVGRIDIDSGKLVVANSIVVHSGNFTF